MNINHVTDDISTVGGAAPTLGEKTPMLYEDLLTAVGNICNPDVDLFAGKYSGNLTVTRNTPATACTYVDPYGVVQYADPDTIRVEKEGWLIEGSSENLILQAEDFSTSWSSDGGAVVTTNSIAAPDGNVTADTVTISTGGGPERVSQSRSITDTGQQITQSFHLKDSTIGNVHLRMLSSGGTSVDTYVNFDMTTKTFSNPTNATAYTYDDDYADGWIRVDLTTTLNNTGNTAIDHRVGGAIGPAATGDFYIWGTQMEQSGVSSSYIPTTTVAVTRQADDIDLDYYGNMPLITDAWTIGFDIHIHSLAGINQGISMFEGSNTFPRMLLTAAGAVYLTHESGGVNSGFIVTEGVTHRILYSYDGSGNITITVDGIDRITEAATLTDINKTNIAIGCAVTSYLNGHISNVRTWFRQLDATERALA